MKTQSNRIKLGVGALALGVGMAATTASALDVKLLDSQFTTYVFVATNSGWSEGLSRTTVSPVPTSDTLHGIISGQPGAQATTGLFGLSTFTDMGRWGNHQLDLPGHNSTARAESEISFSPLLSGTAALDVSFFGADEWFYSAGAVCLLDLTSNQELWNYAWDSGAGNVPWSDGNPGPWRALATLSLNTPLNATDTYKLTMHTQTYADSDRQQISMKLNGLTVAAIVPEPSAFALVSLGGAALLARHRRRDHAE